MDKPNDNTYFKKIPAEKWTLDKDKIDILKKHAKNKGESLYDFLDRAIKETLNRDNEKRFNNYKNNFLKKHPEREVLKAHAESMGEQLKEFLNRAIEETLKRDKDKEDKIYFTLDKNKIKKDIFKHAEKLGESVDDFINRAIRRTLQRDIEEEIVRAANDGKIKPNEVWEREWKEGKTFPIKAGKVIEHK